MPPACSPFWGFHWLFGAVYVSTWWLGALLYFCEKYRCKLGRDCIHSGHCLRKNGHFNNTDLSILSAWDIFPFIGVIFIFFINVWKCSVCRSFSSDQFGCSVVSDFATPWTAAREGSLSITNFLNLLKLMSLESVMPSNHLILCRPLFLPPWIFASIKVFTNESVLCIRWPKYWSSSSSLSPSNEYIRSDFL